MRLHTIDTGFFKLDGGAMFGIVPRRLWAKLHPPDENNMCTWAMRCLLIEQDDRRILIDTGIGDKQGAKFRSHFEPHGEDTLLGSITKCGFGAEDITDVLITHLHFDHVGGAVRYNDAGKLVPTFPNATYWSNKIHYDWAYSPNEKERASFLKENFVPLKDAGVLKFIEPAEQDVDWLPGIQIRFVFGHTEAMMVPIIDTGNGKLIYCADVIPSTYHIGMPYIMAFDVRPLRTLTEKERLLREALRDDAVLFFEHDPKIPCCRVGMDDQGRIVLDKAMTLEELTI